MVEGEQEKKREERKLKKRETLEEKSKNIFLFAGQRWRESQSDSHAMSLGLFLYVVFVEEMKRRTGHFFVSVLYRCDTGNAVTSHVHLSLSPLFNACCAILSSHPLHIHTYSLPIDNRCSS